MGGSYGGFMVLAALTDNPEMWAAGVDIVGIANFVTFLENTGPWRRKLREAEYGSLEHHRAVLEADLADPQGRPDRGAAVRRARRQRSARPDRRGRADRGGAARPGAPVEYLRYEDEGHGLVKLTNKLDASESHRWSPGPPVHHPSFSLQSMDQLHIERMSG